MGATLIKHTRARRAQRALWGRGGGGGGGTRTGGRRVPTADRHVRMRGEKAKWQLQGLKIFSGVAKTVELTQISKSLSVMCSLGVLTRFHEKTLNERRRQVLQHQLNCENMAGRICACGKVRRREGMQPIPRF